MAKEELSTCRICNKYVEVSLQMELINEYTKIVERIRKVVGVELLNNTQMPSTICQQCKFDLEIAEEFRWRCIRSNEYLESVCQDFKLEESLEEEEEPFLVPQIKCEEESEGDEKNERIESESISNPENDEKDSSQKPIFVPNRKQKEQPNRAIICDVCGNTFNRKHVFALHLRRHTKNKTYNCELCSNTFYTNSELKRHMRKHTGEKPYECRYCNRRFSDYGTHTKHERTHTNDRPFSCTRCNKSFSCGFVLKNHMLIHTGERAFTCEVCNKSFGRQHHLTTHVKTIYHQKNLLRKINPDKAT